MKVIFWIDAWLIAQFERFSHWTQQWLGWTNYTWARLATLGFVVAVVGSYFAGEQRLMGFFIWDLITGFLIGLFSIAEEQRASSRLRERVANPIKASKVGHMLRFLFVMIVLIRFIPLAIMPFGTLPDGHWTVGHALPLLRGLCITCSLFFLSCDPLPPGTSKIRQWLNSVRDAFTTLQQPVPIRIHA